MASTGFRIGKVVLCMVLCAAAAAEAALLDGGAFEAPTACPVEPFADPSLGEREHSLGRDCGRNRLDLRVDTPRAQPTDTGPSRLVLEVDQVMTRQVLDAFTATARLGWSGATQEGFSRMETGRALLAAGGRLRLHEQWAVDMNLGRDIGPGPRSRATMAGTWRRRMITWYSPSWRRSRRRGERRRLPLVAGAGPRSHRRHCPAQAGGDTVEPRLGLQVFGFAR